jgi:hypothetical protein
MSPYLAVRTLVRFAFYTLLLLPVVLAMGIAGGGSY